MPPAKLKKLVSLGKIAHNLRRKAGWTIIFAHPGEIRKEAAKAYFERVIQSFIFSTKTIPDAARCQK